MKTVKYIFFVLIIIAQLTSNAQYNWEQVALPDSIGAGSICFYDNDIYLATGNGVYHSNDHCASWEFIGLGQHPIRSIHVSATGNLYAGISSQIFRYAGNYQWDLLYTTQEASNILSIFESNNGNIFFGNWGGIFRSTDGGENWMKVLDLYNTEVVNAIAENSEGKLFAGSISFSGDIGSGGIYSSIDGGATWQLIGLEYHFVSSIVINADDEIFVGTDGHWYTGSGRIYKSADNGQTWDIVLNNHILSLSINEHNEVATASKTGIFCTYDDGIAWENITPSDTVVYYEKVVFNPQNNLYAISYFVYSDLYRTIEPVSVNNNLRNNQDEITVYPNPSNNKIFLSSKYKQYKEFYITNLSGKLIKTKCRAIGENGFEINISDLTPSVYIIRCKSDYIISTVKFIKF